MAKEVLDRWMPSTLSELRDAVAEMVQETYLNGVDPDTVYVDVRDLGLVKKTLTDGSTVLDVTVRENK